MLKSGLRNLQIPKQTLIASQIVVENGGIGLRLNCIQQDEAFLRMSTGRRAVR